MWGAVTFSNVYLENLDMKTAIDSAFNQAGRTSDETILGRVVEAGNHVGTHKADDGFGNLVEVKGLGLTADQVTIFRDEVRKTILIKVVYTQEVPLWPTKKIKVVRFVVTKEGPVPVQ